MYIRVDKVGRVIEVYEQERDDLIFTNWESEDSLMDEHCVYKYKHLGDGVVDNRTQEEMDEDYAMLPHLPKSDSERIELLEKENKELKERNAFIEDCIAEMAMLLYA